MFDGMDLFNFRHTGVLLVLHFIRCCAFCLHLLTQPRGAVHAPTCPTPLLTARPSAGGAGAGAEPLDALLQGLVGFFQDEQVARRMEEGLARAVVAFQAMSAGALAAGMSPTEANGGEHGPA